jgi:hypothetical protein
MNVEVEQSDLSLGDAPETFAIYANELNHRLFRHAGCDGTAPPLEHRHIVVREESTTAHAHRIR